MIENQLLELSDNIYNITRKDTIESVFLKVSETETFVINKTQMTLEKAVDDKAIELQMVNSIKSPTISNNDIEPLPYHIDQPVDWKKIINVIKDRFTKIEDALIDLQTQQFSSKNENALYNVQNSGRELVIDILKKKISDLKFELQRKNVVIDYLHSQLSLKVT